MNLLFSEKFKGSVDLTEDNPSALKGATGRVLKSSTAVTSGTVRTSFRLPKSREFLDPCPAIKESGNKKLSFKKKLIPLIPNASDTFPILTLANNQSFANLTKELGSFKETLNKQMSHLSTNVSVSLVELSKFKTQSQTISNEEDAQYLKQRARLMEADANNAESHSRHQHQLRLQLETDLEVARIMDLRDSDKRKLDLLYDNERNEAKYRDPEYARNEEHRRERELMKLQTECQIKLMQATSNSNVHAQIMNNYSTSSSSNDV